MCTQQNHCFSLDSSVLSTTTLLISAICRRTWVSWFAAILLENWRKQMFSFMNLSQCSLRCAHVTLISCHEAGRKDNNALHFCSAQGFLHGLEKTLSDMTGCGSSQCWYMTTNINKQIYERCRCWPSIAANFSTGMVLRCPALNYPP